MQQQLGEDAPYLIKLNYLADTEARPERVKVVEQKCKR